MPANIDAYLDLVTSEHRARPAFIATVSLLVQALADNRALVETMPGLFDLDVAVGQQLDVVGEWVGRSRQLAVPLTDVYFTLDQPGLGFDEGTWLGPFDPTTGLISLPDDSYRTLLRGAIAANQWDGTIPGAYAIWDIVFGSRVYGVDFVGDGEIVFVGTGPIDFSTRSLTLIQDYGDMSMLVALIGPPPDAVTIALLVAGYLSLKPAGVREVDYVGPSVPWAPLFGFDAETDTVAGFDVGGWAVTLPTL